MLSVLCLCFNNLINDKYFNDLIKNNFPSTKNLSSPPM